MKRIAAASLAALVALTGLAGAGGNARAQDAINPADFRAQITHPLFPLSSFTLKVFEGEDEDPDTGEAIDLRLESRMLAETAVVAGVTVAVLEERDYEDGELVEVARDYFAQHRDGSVWYFGEDVDNYEDGAVSDHHGTWRAGVDGAQPGTIMPAQPKVGETFSQEDAPGVAEDKATVLALDETVTVPAGSWNGCLKTRDFNPLEPGVEESKWYCAGVGLVKEQGETSLNELVSMTAAPATPAPNPTTSAAPAPRATPPAGVVAPNTGTGRGADTTPWLAAALAAVGSVIAAGGVAVMRRRHRGRTPA